VIARSRAGAGGTGADYLYTYLRTYYRDDTKATGWNNLAFPNVGMPHVLWELQGERRPVFDTQRKHGHEVKVFKGWEQVTPGTMSPQEYDQASVTWCPTCSGWPSRPRTRACASASGCCCSWLSVHRLRLALNAAFWKDVK
jgi:ubiquinol-cytochrome c reductase cytochrome c1 subunit